MPCESTPRRSVSTIISAVVSAWASDMPQARRTEASWLLIRDDATRMAGDLLDLETRVSVACRMSRYESLVRDLLRQAGIVLGGPAPHDLHVHDDRFYERVIADGSLGLGESYMDGWWTCAQLDEFFCRLLRARVDSKVRLPWRQVLAAGVADRKSVV